MWKKCSNISNPLKECKLKQYWIWCTYHNGPLNESQLQVVMLLWSSLPFDSELGHVTYLAIRTSENVIHVWDYLLEGGCHPWECPVWPPWGWKTTWRDMTSFRSCSSRLSPRWMQPNEYTWEKPAGLPNQPTEWWEIIHHGYFKSICQYSLGRGNYTAINNWYTETPFSFTELWEIQKFHNSLR